MKPHRQTRPGTNVDTPSSARDRAPDAGDVKDKTQEDDKVGEASEESFPASDAPSFVATTGSMANGRDKKISKHRR